MLPIILALPALATTGIVYGRRDVRAFCIGALFPASLGLGGAVFVVARILERTIDPMAIYYTSAFWNEFSEYAIDPLLVIAIVSWTSSAMIGAATLLFRRLVMSGTNELVSGVGESMN